MSKTEAAKLVKKMLGSYASVNLHDPETYVANIVVLLIGYPLWAGEYAIEKAIEEAKFSPPSVGMLKPFLENQVRVHRYAAEWERGAQRLLALPPPEDCGGERRAFIARRRAESGPHFGIGAWKTENEPSIEDIRAGIIARIGQTAFDEIPDKGFTSDEWQKLNSPQIGEAAE